MGRGGIQRIGGGGIIIVGLVTTEVSDFTYSTFCSPFYLGAYCFISFPAAGRAMIAGRGGGRGILFSSGFAADMSVLL